MEALDCILPLKRKSPTDEVEEQEITVKRLKECEVSPVLSLKSEAFALRTVDEEVLERVSTPEGPKNEDSYPPPLEEKKEQIQADETKKERIIIRIKIPSYYRNSTQATSDSSSSPSFSLKNQSKSKPSMKSKKGPSESAVSETMPSTSTQGIGNESRSLKSSFAQVVNEEMLDDVIAENGGTFTFKTAAAAVLSCASRCMHCTEILSWMLNKKMIQTTGLTPQNTLNANINQDINKRKNTVFAKYGQGLFTLKTKIADHIKNMVILPEEADNGMSILENSSIPLIPVEKEDLWLYVKDSTVPNAGKGLFAKQKIREGTLFCEYRGPIRDLDVSKNFYPYGLSVTMADGVTKILDGKDDKGRVPSLAAHANDAGPYLQNTLYAEFIEFPGRVFLEAKRDIQPDEEVFVLYGAKYWGLPSYPPQSMFSKVECWTELPHLSSKGITWKDTEELKSTAPADGDGVFLKLTVSDSSKEQMKLGRGLKGEARRESKTRSKQKKNKINKQKKSEQSVEGEKEKSGATQSDEVLGSETSSGNESEEQSTISHETSEDEKEKGIGMVITNPEDVIKVEMITVEDVNKEMAEQGIVTPQGDSKKENNMEEEKIQKANDDTNEGKVMVQEHTSSVQETAVESIQTEKEDNKTLTTIQSGEIIVEVGGKKREEGFLEVMNNEQEEGRREVQGTSTEEQTKRSEQKEVNVTAAEEEVEVNVMDG